MPPLFIVARKVMQCHDYYEHGIEVVDENAENYERALDIVFDPPLVECLRNLTTFTVSYRIETPWTEPPHQEKNRTVRVVNANECTSFERGMSNSCPMCAPQCSAEALCVDTEGSYTCQCPEPCSRGDGFNFITPEGLAGAVPPEGYVNGSGELPDCSAPGPAPH